MIEKARVIFDKHVKNEQIRKHCLKVASIMKAVAASLGEDSERWEIAGLMHDSDCELVGIEEQGNKAAEILEKESFDSDICHAIRAHNEENTKVNRESKFDYVLSAADNISGLIYAYALMRGSMEGMKIKGLKEKLKMKSFAATVRRDLIYDIEKFMPLDKFLEIAIKAIKEIKQEIGLK